MRDLLERKIDSFEKFEVVRRIWLRQAESLNVATITEGLQLPEGAIAATLAGLAAEGIILHEDGDRYRAATDSSDADTIKRMLALYARDPLSMLRTLNEIALRRLRGLAARKFSDAFILSRKKENGDG